MGARREPPSAGAKMRVLKRDRFTCTYCGAPGTSVELEVDHIIPSSKGGSNHISNLTTACRKCNQKKGNGPVPESYSGKSMSRSIEGIVGLFVHLMNEDGEITRQGMVVSERGEYAMVQMFDWLDGAPVCVRPILVSDLFDEEKAALYGTGQQMSRAFWEQEQRAGRLVGTVDQQLDFERRILGVH